MPHQARTKKSSRYLPALQDLLRTIEDLCELTGVSKSELAKLLDEDRSAITRVFSGERRLLYEEAETILDYLQQRLSPLSDEPIKSLCIQAKALVRVQATDTVTRAVEKMLNGGFTQLPVFNGQNYMGLITDRMILDRLLHPNQTKFKGKWIDYLRRMSVEQADIIETSAVYPANATISSVANALGQFYAVMVSENNQPSTIVTRWDYLKLLTS